RARPRCALDPDVAAMRLDHPLRDEKTQARPAFRAARDPKELLEQPRLVALRDAGPAIGDLETDPRRRGGAMRSGLGADRLGPGTQDDLAIAGREPDRVRDQVREHRLH